MSGRFEVVLDAAFGGRLASLVLDGHELLVRRDDPAPDGAPGLAGDDPVTWGCFVMAPWAGRVRDGVLVHDGARHQLPRRDPPHALHGVVCDRAWRPLTGDQPRVVLHDGGFAAVGVRLDDGWPWRGTVVRHEVAVKAAAVVLDVAVEVREPQPVVVGWHPWFRRRVGGRDVEVELPDRARMLARDADGMPAGPVAVPDGPWDDTFVDVGRTVALRWGELRVTLVADASAWVLFTEPAHAVCVEPQTAPPNAFERREAALVTPTAPLRFRMAVQAP